MLELLNIVAFPPLILVIGLILDLLFGDPERLPHPVRWIGSLISFLENVIRCFAKTPAGEKLGGIALTVLVVGITYAVSLALLYYSYRYSLIAFYVVASYMVWTSLSIKSLKKEARAVVKILNEKGVVAARTQLSRIVGRDTKELPKEGVLKATVETVAENSSDGVIAPLFYLSVGGPALMMAYKAVNTLDSMVGYKNDRYRHFGWASARFDDLANFIPARMAGALIACTAFILGYNWKGSFLVMARDGGKHPSPNSGVPEAAVAGALSVRLGGPSYYGGVLSDKPYIGDKLTDIDEASVERAIRLMETSALMMASITLFIRIALMFMA